MKEKTIDMKEKIVDIGMKEDMIVKTTEEDLLLFL
jgi:hypothetical protein